MNPHVRTLSVFMEHWIINLNYIPICCLVLYAHTPLMTWSSSQVHTCSWRVVKEALLETGKCCRWGKLSESTSTKVHQWQLTENNNETGSNNIRDQWVFPVCAGFSGSLTLCQSAKKPLGSSNIHFYFVTKPSFFPFAPPRLPPPLSSSLPTFFFCNSWCVFVLAALHSLFDVVSRSPELQSLATLSVIGRPAVSLASIDSF